MKKVLKALVFAILPALQAGSWAAEPAPRAQPEEIVVVGRQPGPPLWRVSNGDRVLWIFPYLSTVPKDMIWESERVDRVIAESQEYIGRPRIEADTSPLLLVNPVNWVRGYRLVKRLSRNPDGACVDVACEHRAAQRLDGGQSQDAAAGTDLEHALRLFSCAGA